jgi:hypothetical protein
MPCRSYQRHSIVRCDRKTTGGGGTDSVSLELGGNLLSPSADQRCRASFSISHDHGVQDLPTNDATPPVEAQSPGVVSHVFEDVLDHDALATRAVCTIHCGCTTSLVHDSIHSRAGITKIRANPPAMRMNECEQVRQEGVPSCLPVVEGRARRVVCPPPSVWNRRGITASSRVPPAGCRSAPPPGSAPLPCPTC